MNTNAVAKNYANLTPEERFRLILVASGRGDETERNRLANSGQRITLTMQDHAPYADAFDELTLLTFIELLDEAALYIECFAGANVAQRDTLDAFDADEDREEGDGAEDPTGAADAEAAEIEAGDQSIWVRSLDLALATGYVLRTKVDGWKLFCERLNVPPWLLLEGMPGFDRLRRALKLTNEAAFAPKGFLRWMNDHRPTGAPQLTKVLLTVEGIAHQLEETYHERAKWLSGKD